MQNNHHKRDKRQSMARQPVHGRLFTQATTMSLPAPPEQVFPLLCPVLEYDWIPYWDCRMVHSSSGVAEKDCVFETDLPDRGHEIWICTRYEPPHNIEYVRWSSRGLVRRLTITLGASQDQTTSMLWETSATPLTPEGKAMVERMAQGQYGQEILLVENLLRHYLATGTMLD
ncbi:MAG: hypothetical protein KKE73_09870 [Proteobacteria bacterium]|nr:hypothetical protein [Pseudomonadota bacterium]